MKILAVDDDSFILELIPMIAAGVGFPDVTTVPSGEQALERLADPANVFDCFLLDIQMPGMDGIELCRMIRALPGHAKTPVIMLTAMTDRAFIDRAFKAGATDYATKPFDITELGARLRLARELVKARREMAAALAERPNVPENAGRDAPSVLSAVLVLDGVEALVDLAALGNYLTQLYRSGSVGCQVIAIKIDRVEDIHARMSQREFERMLARTAGVIGQALGSEGHLMAYAGNGVFLCISNATYPESSCGVEMEIQNLLDARGFQQENGEAIDLRISIGNPIGPISSKTQLIRRTFDRAISRAESRSRKKLVAPRPLIGLRSSG